MKTKDCPCGATVQLVDPLDNECPECGANYNLFGQRVRPSSRCDAQGEPVETAEEAAAEEAHYDQCYGSPGSLYWED